MELLGEVVAVILCTPKILRLLFVWDGRHSLRQVRRQFSYTFSTSQLSVEKSQYGGFMVNVLRLWRRPEVHLPTNWSPVFSHLMYRLITLDIAQLVRRQMDVIDGHSPC